MQNFVSEIYKQYKYDLNMFGFDPDECDDDKTDSYVYAWYVKGQYKKYFYIGKGKKDRYKHILKEIETYEKNPRKYKGKPYKLLKDVLGIEYEFLYTNLTAKEATILEAYQMLMCMNQGHPLLNVILPCGVMNDEELIEKRDAFFYEMNDDKFLNYYNRDKGFFD